MKKVVVVCSLLWLIMGSSFVVNKEDDKISWSKDRKLTWKDFKGKPNNGGQVAAMTDSGFSYESGKMENDSMQLIIVNFFYKNTSWVKKNEEKENILAHEQCHFDITELFTRKFRKQIKESKFNLKTLKNSLESLFKKSQTEWKNYEDKYDKETEHSKKEVQQLEWQEKVAKELEEFDGYTDSTVKVFLGK